MSTHKLIDKICCVILALTLLLTIVFMNGEQLGIEDISTQKEYETHLFDTSVVHTINIEMDDWDSFVENCPSEEYESCNLTIDGETYSNVAIRGKGNTSLTNVKNYGNNRYSFKIEFDHYDDSVNYYGLDKLTLNNIIQDKTYMKDFLTYQLMGGFGVSAPLCSYVQILVNGEEWGLYLAVESIEESFLKRNYGNDYGELYKPDSMSMGGGGEAPEKGEKPDEAAGEAPQAESQDTAAQTEGAVAPAEGATPPNAAGAPTDAAAQGPMGEMPEGMMGVEMSLEQIKTTIEALDEANKTSLAETLGYESASAMSEALGSATDVDTFLNGKTMQDVMQAMMPQGGGAQGPGGGMGGGMGSDDVSLIYSDDDFDSYANIFDNAKTDVTDTDKERLISALKNINENTDLESSVDIDAVMRYFVVHNFVCNGDSYTGSMIHNYYLYEEDGQLSMLPWDYNLAFGGFSGGGNATSLVNTGIDSPVSGGTIESRPMLAWIFENDAYTELYHQYFAEFMAEYFDSGYVNQLIEDTEALIAPYVESDPTAFFTYDEFTQGVDTLKSFCALRAESINAQLDGTIATTDEEQEQSTLIDASALSITDMGEMGNMGGDQGDGGGPMGPGGAMPGEASTADGEAPTEPAENAGTSGEASTEQADATEVASDPPFTQSEAAAAGQEAPTVQAERGGGSPPAGMAPSNDEGTGTVSKENLLILGLSFAVLAMALLVAYIYKKRA